jgi:outer membrane receptor protein involved in Fe transport
VPLQKTTLSQDVIEATAQGHVADLPAGELRFAVGANYREDSFDYRPDSDVALGTIVGVNRSGASSGSTHVVEGYGELLIPLLADIRFVEKLDLDVAYRRSKYKLSGSVNTYKADANWTVVPSLRFRGGYQRAVRAPNVGELFTAPTAGFAGIGEITAGGGDPCASNSAARAGANAAQIQALCVAQGVPAALVGTFINAQNEIPSTNVGNVNLTPESADTYTVGAVLNAPSDNAWLRGLQVSVDYYDISIEGVVGVIAGQQALNKCYNLDGSNPSYSIDNYYCGLLGRNATTGSLTSALQQTLNLGAFKTKGIDLQADWRLGLDDLGLGASAGSVALNTVVSRLLSFDVQNQPGGAFADYSNTVGASTNGALGSLPNWKATTSARYLNGSGSAGLRWRYISEMRALAKVSNPNSTTPNTKANNLFDLFANWGYDDHLQLSGGVNNVFDKDPPVVNGVSGTTEPSTYDILGRTYFIALRVTL